MRNASGVALLLSEEQPTPSTSYLGYMFEYASPTLSPYLWLPVALAKPRAVSPRPDIILRSTLLANARLDTFLV